MINIFVPLITLGLLGWAVNRLLQADRDLVFNDHPEDFYQNEENRLNAQAMAQEEVPLSHEELQKLVAAYGSNCNSFFGLYSGWKTFSVRIGGRLGAITYFDMPRAWVAAANPFAPVEDHPELLKRFAQAAARRSKSALVVALYASTVKVAREQGYGSLMIGSEPQFLLDRYPRTGKTWQDVVVTSKQLGAKGAQVREILPKTMTAQEKTELDLVTKEWLKSRKMKALDFLNRVEPWELSEYKRYFVVEYNGRILAFLAAIPIWAKKGWYLVDLLRRKDTPPGTTEFLLLNTMRMLKDSGAEEATMGVSPLSLLDQVAEFPEADLPNHLNLYRFLRFMYEKGNQLYNFKSLWTYKLKFEPSRYEPVYLIYKNEFGRPVLSTSAFLSLLQAFAPEGVLLSILSGALRLVQKFSLADLIKKLLKTSIVVRSVPPNFWRLLYRCKFSVTMIALNTLVYFFTTTSTGNLPPSTEGDWGYSWNSFLESPMHSLILSPFLHWNIGHLCLNLLFSVIFVAGLEYLAGSGLTALCYLLGMIFSNPLTSLGLMSLQKIIPKAWLVIDNPYTLDVGCSLGVFSCLGALFWFLKPGKWIIGAFYLGILVQSIVTGDWLVMDHWTSIAIGILTGYFVFRN